MKLPDLLSILFVVGLLLVVTVFLRVIFRSPKVKSVVIRLFPILAPIISSIGRKTEDIPGKFDSHDVWVIVGRALRDVAQMLEDPTNVTFDDVRDDVFRLVARELDRYREAGVQGVPDIEDEVLREQVEAIFEAVKVIFSESQSGNHTEN